jgi:chorismate-pyruvate lyase
MNHSLRPHPDLDALLGLFYADPDRLGRFEQVEPSDLPQPQEMLLNHHEHMTVTLESFHESRVRVKVLKTNITSTHYSRKIVLERESDGKVVLFGIVRLDMRCIDEPVRREIQSQKTPLGRILIEHNVLRQVELVDLLRIECGPDLEDYLGPDASPVVYGRTALIHCNGEPAVELLEIVAP